MSQQMYLRAIGNCLIRDRFYRRSRWREHTASDAWLACPSAFRAGHKTWLMQRQGVSHSRQQNHCRQARSTFAGTVFNLLIYRSLLYARVIYLMDHWGTAPRWLSPSIFC